MRDTNRTTTAPNALQIVKSHPITTTGGGNHDNDDNAQQCLRILKVFYLGIASRTAVCDDTLSGNSAPKTSNVQACAEKPLTPNTGVQGILSTPRCRRGWVWRVSRLPMQHVMQGSRLCNQAYGEKYAPKACRAARCSSILAKTNGATTRRSNSGRPSGVNRIANDWLSRLATCEAEIIFTCLPVSSRCAAGEPSTSSQNTPTGCDAIVPENARAEACSTHSNEVTSRPLEWPLWHAVGERRAVGVPIAEPRIGHHLRIVVVVDARLWIGVMERTRRASG